MLLKLKYPFDDTGKCHHNGWKIKGTISDMITTARLSWSEKSENLSENILH